MADNCGLSQEHINDLHERFNTIDINGDGYLSIEELGPALDTLGLRLAGYEVRDLLKEFDDNRDGKISSREFARIYSKVHQQKDLGQTFKKNVKTRTGVVAKAGTSDASSAGTTHTVKDSESIAFTDWINRCLDDDEEFQKYKPLTKENLLKKVTDGIILCKLINKSEEGLIDERTINKNPTTVFKKHENLTLALNSAESIGCSIVNIGAEDIEKGNSIHLVFGLIWQIIRLGLLNDIDLAHHPGLLLLLEEGESPEDLAKLTPEQLLVRWVNYHLRNANAENGLQISNLTDDIKDSTAYTYLLTQIAPQDAGVTLHPLHVGDLEERAEAVLQEADKFGARNFVGPKDIVTGNSKLNLAFVASLFNAYPKLDGEGVDLELLKDIEETREERTYKNWINSLVSNPYVNYLYTDLASGVVIFRLYDKIKPGCVDWSRVAQKFQKMKVNFQKLENCNYAIDIGKSDAMKFKIPSTGGQDLRDGEVTLTLGLVWQMMRAYTLKLLYDISHGDRPVEEDEIVNWVNEKLSGKDGIRINGFGDQKIADGNIVLRVIDKIKPGVVNWDLFNQGATTEEKHKSNAKYAISLARKIGARVYALPEDIVECKKKMVMTLFACLMVVDNPYAGGRDKANGQQQQVSEQLMDGLKV